jgi:NAD(P)-dependent dehydrogenase (short-subunit alcohol dehydrogenase family)
MDLTISPGGATEAALIDHPVERKAYIITGPTSGIGRCAAFQLAKQGTLVLVGRDPSKLDALQAEICARGQHAVSVVCDLADLAGVHRAADQIVSLRLPIAGLLNNAGVMQMLPTKNALGWDATFATNYLGPFALTEALMPHLPDGANIVFVASAAEDPERKQAVAAGFRGGRYISAAASARGTWAPGGSKLPGGDAYATSKQCVLAAAMTLARETPRLRVNAFEPGFTPNTGLGRDAHGLLRFLARYILPLVAPHIKSWSTPERAGRVATQVLLDASGRTGVYYDDGGHPMLGSKLAQDPAFGDRVVAETRALIMELQPPQTPTMTLR